MQTHTLGTPLILSLMLLFFGGTFLLSLSIGRKRENADNYMTAGNQVGFRQSVAPKHSGPARHVFKRGDVNRALARFAGRAERDMNLLDRLGTTEA